jgi:putative lipoprotein
MLDKIAELLVFGLMPLAVSMLVMPGQAATSENARVHKVSGEAGVAPVIIGKDWQVEFIDGIDELPQPRATLRIDEGGRIGGKGPCNGYSAVAEIDGKR